MRSPSYSKSRIDQKQQRKACKQTHTMAGRTLHHYMGIGKNGSSKRSRNLACFPGFSKKPARIPTHMGKWGLAKRYRTAQPIKTTPKIA
jgi:hypothetical protein